MHLRQPPGDHVWTRDEVTGEVSLGRVAQTFVVDDRIDAVGDLKFEVGLEQDAVDLLEVDGLDAVAYGLDERAEAKIADAAQDALGGAHDERERLRVKTE